MIGAVRILAARNFARKVLLPARSAQTLSIPQGVSMPSYLSSPGHRSAVKVATAALLWALCSMPALAQATRTWVSGVGDDVNPCSRTAPCKTWAGAISKTAAGGEIDALDPGGFGTVTITKAITLDGGAGQVGSILASGTTGIVVRAGAGDDVVLRNLSINGAGTTLGTTGVKFLSGKTLRLQNVKIERFSQDCIAVSPDNTVLNLTSMTTQIIDSVASNCANGLSASSTATTPVTVSADRSRFVFHSATGVRAAEANTLVQVSNSTVFGNLLGLSAINQANLNSLGGNQTLGNTTNGAFTSTSPSN